LFIPDANPVESDTKGVVSDTKGVVVVTPSAMSAMFVRVEHTETQDEQMHIEDIPLPTVVKYGNRVHLRKSGCDHFMVAVVAVSEGREPPLYIEPNPEDDALVPAADFARRIGLEPRALLRRLKMGKLRSGPPENLKPEHKRD
jgi:hypothetical protein